MVKAKKTSANGMPRRGSQATYAWREYRGEGDGEDVPPYMLKVRSDVRHRDTDHLVFEVKTPMPEIWDSVAPYVIDWNVDDESGEPVPPPAEAGGMVFNYLPTLVFWKAFNDIKFGSSGTVDSKFWKPSAASTADGSSDGSTTTTS